MFIDISTISVCRQVIRTLNTSSFLLFEKAFSKLFDEKNNVKRLFYMFFL